MTSSKDDIIKTIHQYQERLERYSLSKSEDKMLYILEKLSKLQIRTLHLENTGVGRTVNALKKLGGSVGDAAKELVALWKEMVLQEENATHETSIENEDDADSVYSSDNENKDCHKEDSSKETISHSENDEIESEGYGSKQEVPRKSNDLENCAHTFNNGDSSRNNHKSNSSPSSSDSDEEISRKQAKHHSRKRNHSTNSSSDERETIHSKKSKKDRNDPKKDDHKYKFSTESKYERREKLSSSKHKESSNKHKESSEKHKESSEKYKRSSDKQKESSDRSESRHRSRKDSEHDAKKSKKEFDEEKKYKQKKDLQDLKLNHKTEKNKKNEEKQLDRSHSNHKLEKHNEKTDKNTKSSHSSKDKDKYSSHSNSTERDKKEKHKFKRDKKEEKHSETKSKENNKEDKQTSLSKSKDSQSSSSSKHKSSNSHGNEKKKIKSDKVLNTGKQKIVHGIDSESGASFAEALGMCGPVTASIKKKPSSDKHKLNHNSNKFSEDVDNESSKSRKSKHDDSECSTSKLDVPDLLKEEPVEPLNICLSSLLPEITPNYKPLGLSYDSQPKRLYTDDEALNRLMTNKTQRTKVYSGNKTVGKVESLFQLCVRILQDNIDALEYTGGVPYLILKPIMERATPDQIFNLEHHNPYLIEDTDELWQLHCQKDFRTKQRQEMESWRDMYMRCLDEREARLNAVKANIKLSIDKSIPVRTTKLAYVDSEFVKPPRNVARKQVKNGTIVTDRKITPSQKLTALAQSGEASKVSVPDPGRKATDRSSGSGTVSNSASIKPKKAPLMAKTLSFLKNRFRR